MNNITTIQISADTVAWYGAIVATLAFFIGAVDFIYKVLGDKPKIKLTMRPHMMIYPNGLPPHPKDTVFLTFDIVNMGKIPVMIDTAGYKFKKNTPHKSYAIVMTGGAWGEVGKLPYQINPGQRYTVYGLQKDIVKELDAIEYFLVQDATGKEYRAKLSRKLKADILKKV